MAGPQSQTFTPISTVTLSATSSSSRVQLPTVQLPPGQVRISVFGDDNAYIAFGDNSITADSSDIFMPTGGTEVFTIPPSGAYIAAISSSTNGCTLNITVGNGM